MWFNSKVLLGFGMTLFLLGWEYCVRMAFNIDNPLALLTGTEQYEAQMIYLGVLGMMAVIMALLGQFTAYVFDLPELLPLWTLLPIARRTPLSFKDRVSANSSGSGEEVSEAKAELDAENQTGLERNGIMNIPRPTSQCLVSLILFLFTVVTPHIIYSLIMDDHRIAGLVCVVLIPTAGYVLLGLYCYYMTDLWTMGQTKKNTKSYNNANREGIDAGKIEPLEITKEIEKETKERVLLTVLIIGIIHVASNLILGLVRYFQDDVDWNWITAAIIGAVIALFTIIVAVYFWYVANVSNDDDDCRSRKKRKAKETEQDEDGDVDEDGVKVDTLPTASYYGSSGQSTNQRKSAVLGHELLGNMK